MTKLPVFFFKHSFFVVKTQFWAFLCISESLKWSCYSGLHTQTSIFSLPQVLSIYHKPLLMYLPVHSISLFLLSSLAMEPIDKRGSLVREVFSQSNKLHDKTEKWLFFRMNGQGFKLLTYTCCNISVVYLYFWDYLRLGDFKKNFRRFFQ